MKDQSAQTNEDLQKALQAEHLRLIGRTGWIALIAWGMLLIAWGAVDPEPYAMGWRLVLELMFLGHLVSIADGISLGFSNAYLLLQNILQDIIVLLICYPWIVAGYQAGVKRSFFARRLDKLRRHAERNKRIVEPFGAVGLWVFVFFPFWSTGVLVGGIVGYLMGMRTWVVFVTVFLGHCLSVIVCVLFFDAAYSMAQKFNEGVARFLPFIVIGLLIAGSLIYRALAKLLRSLNHDQNESPQRPRGE